MFSSCYRFSRADSCVLNRQEFSAKLARWSDYLIRTCRAVRRSACVWGRHDPVITLRALPAR
jgi:hypothetical protein